MQFTHELKAEVIFAKLQAIYRTIKKDEQFQTHVYVDVLRWHWWVWCLKTRKTWKYIIQ
jgi:hypothetical protein